jgi:hypothetical protein
MIKNRLRKGVSRIPAGRRETPGLKEILVTIGATAILPVKNAVTARGKAHLTEAALQAMIALKDPMETVLKVAIGQKRATTGNQPAINAAIVQEKALLMAIAQKATVPKEILVNVLLTRGLNKNMVISLSAGQRSGVLINPLQGTNSRLSRAKK